MIKFIKQNGVMVWCVVATLLAVILLPIVIIRSVNDIKSAPTQYACVYETSLKEVDINYIDDGKYIYNYYIIKCVKVDKNKEYILDNNNKKQHYVIAINQDNTFYGVIKEHGFNTLSANYYIKYTNVNSITYIEDNSPFTPIE